VARFPETQSIRYKAIRYKAPFRAADKMAIFAIGRAAGGYGGSSPPGEGF